MVGSLVTLASELSDSELSLLIELAIGAVNGAKAYELLDLADRLASEVHARKARKVE